MKKNILIVLGVLLVFLSTKTKAQSFEQGGNYLSVSYGYSIYNSSVLRKVITEIKPDSINQEISFSTTGPIGIQYEYALSNVVGVGFSGGYSKTKVNLDHNYAKASLIFKKITANARVNFHLPQKGFFDPYIGLGVGFKYSDYQASSNFTSIDIPKIPLFSNEIKLGTRFILSEYFGAFVELGMGHGVLNAGLTGKF